MIALKHAEYKIKSPSQLEDRLNHLDETKSRVPGVALKDIYRDNADSLLGRVLGKRVT
jgi:hypothetical protein